jgi:transposase
LTQNSPGGFIRTEEQALTDVEALRYRGRGWTYQRVADEMGVSKSTAYERCRRALAAVPVETVEEYRKVMDAQLDEVLTVALQKAVSGDKGSLFGIDRVVMILDRKAKLWGLDRAVKQQLEVTTYQGGGELERELQRLIEAHASLSDRGESLPVGEGTGPTGATAD